MISSEEQKVALGMVKDSTLLSTQGSDGSWTPGETREVSRVKEIPTTLSILKKEQFYNNTMSTHFNFDQVHVSIFKILNSYVYIYPY
jgi:hypothetical protein